MFLTVAHNVAMLALNATFFFFPFPLLPPETFFFLLVFTNRAKDWLESQHHRFVGLRRKNRDKKEFPRRRTAFGLGLRRRGEAEE